MQNTQGAQGLRVQDEAIKPGVIVIYRLRDDQLPRQPAKEWRGKIVRYERDFRRAIVMSLEAGYEDCEDEVWLEQIIRIEKS